MAVRVEERYRGIRAPHKLKGAVSGCTRECAEAQGKDFGLIATEKGWNLYVCGNGGMRPRHADLIASDIDDDTAIKYIDRFLMYYIHTADKLTRTSVWLENLEGGLDHLKAVIIEDSLGICEELEADMERLVESYKCEWKEVVENPEKRALFSHYANSEMTDSNIEFVPYREQKRPRDWRDSLEEAPTVSGDDAEWFQAAPVEKFPKDGGRAIQYGNTQIAVFNFSSRNEWYASQNMCPHRQDMVLARGIIGDANNRPKVACPLHKKLFSLDSGECLSGEDFSILTFPVKVEDGYVYVKLPPAEELESCIQPACNAMAIGCSHG